MAFQFHLHKSYIYWAPFVDKSSFWMAKEHFERAISIKVAKVGASVMNPEVFAKLSWTVPF